MRYLQAIIFGAAATWLSSWSIALFDGAAKFTFYPGRTWAFLGDSGSGFGWQSMTEVLPGITRVHSRILPSSQIEDWRVKGIPERVPVRPPPYWATANRLGKPPNIPIIPFDQVHPFVVDEAVGWPARSLVYSLQYYRALDESESTPDPLPPGTLSGRVLIIPTTDGAVRSETLQRWFPHRGYLPTHILWPGFLLNTLFWSGVIASPFWLRRGFVAWRTARRRRAGLCPACGYARGGLHPHNPCPECGAASNTPSPATTSAPDESLRSAMKDNPP